MALAVQHGKQNDECAFIYIPDIESEKQPSRESISDACRIYTK